MKNFIIFLFLCILIICLCYLNYYYMTTLISEPQDRASFGDMFGVVNALFSGLAYAGLIYTILLQNKSISMQQQEYQKSEAAHQANQAIVNDQLISMNRTNKIAALSTLVGMYSEDETRYLAIDKSKSEVYRQMKEKLLAIIENELKNYE